MRKSAIIRIRIITGVILLLALTLIFRLYFIQVAEGQAYREKAEGQYVHTVRDLFNRGSIFFNTRDNELVSAATIQTGFLLAINPSLIEDVDYTYTEISKIIVLDSDYFAKKAARIDRTYQEIKKQISRKEAEEIESLNLKGVQLYKNQWRYYPGEDLSARTVGFVGYKGNDFLGKYGLERYYNYILERDNERLSINFFAEIFSNFKDVDAKEPLGKEGDIITSIEPTVARILDKKLRETQEKWNSKVTGGIIINPQTGDIYSFGIAPGYNLNDRSGVEIGQFRNILVEDLYEFGSIIKPLTMAAGLDSGAILPNSTYYDEGFLEMNDARISNYDGKGRGYVPMQEILSQSLNTGVAHIVQEMGKENFRDYFLNLKLGEETGIDLPNEVRGIVTNLKSPRDIEYATASFGQGIAFTPIVAARALSTLANGGVLPTPHIVQEIRYEDGKIGEVVYPEGQRVFSEEAVEDTTRMLVHVVDNALRGGKVKFENYSVAAKTGTAQIPDSENGGYYEDKFLHSFFGYFPAYNPKFLIFLYTIEPKNVRYASETLTTPFIELTEFLINYYNIPPDR